MHGLHVHCRFKGAVVIFVFQVRKEQLQENLQSRNNSYMLLDRVCPSLETCAPNLELPVDRTLH